MTEQPQPLSTRSASDGVGEPAEKGPRKRRFLGIFGSGGGGRPDKKDVSVKPVSAVPSSGPVTGDSPAGGSAAAEFGAADAAKVGVGEAGQTVAGKADALTAEKPSTVLSASETTKDQAAAKGAMDAAKPQVAGDSAGRDATGEGAKVAAGAADAGKSDAGGDKASAGPDNTGAGKDEANKTGAGEAGTGGKRKRKELSDARPAGAPQDPWAAFAETVAEKPPGRIRRGIRALGRGLIHEYSLTIYLSAIFAVGLSWPTLRFPLHTLPQDLGDPSRQAWQISWLGHVLLTNPVKLWQANAYFPTNDTLAYGDSLLGYAPAGLLGTGPEAAVLRYNILFVMAHALLLFGAYALVRQLGARPTGAAVAAAAFAYAPWRLAQEGHLDIVSAGAIPLALALLARGHGWSIRYGFRPDHRNSAWAALGWIVATWQLSLGFALGVPFAYVLGLIVLALLIVVPIRRLLQWRRAKRLKAAQTAEPSKSEPTKKDTPGPSKDEKPAKPEAGTAEPDKKATPPAEPAGQSKQALDKPEQVQSKADRIEKAKPSKAEPTKAEPDKVEPSKVEPDKAEADAAQTDKTEPEKADAEGKNKADAKPASDGQPDKDEAKPDEKQPKDEQPKDKKGDDEAGKDKPATGKAGKKRPSGKKRPTDKPVRKRRPSKGILGWRLLLADYLGVLFFAGVGAVLAIPYFRVPKPDPSTQADFSPELRSLLIGPAESRIWGAAHATPRASLNWPAEMSLLPGFMLYALALAGLLFSIWRWRQRLFLTIGLAVALILTLGTTFFEGRWTYLPLFGHLPASLDQHVPGRLMLWATLILAILAAGAVDEFVRRAEHLSAQRTPSRPGPLLRLATLLPLALVLLEGWSATAHPVTPTQPDALRTVGGPMLVLPTDDLTDQTVQLWTTSRYQQVANGGGNLMVAQQTAMRGAVQSFPDLASISYLRSIGVGTVVLIRSRVAGTPWELAGDLPVDALGIRREDLPDAVVFRLN